MATRRTKRQIIRKKPYDNPHDPENWSKEHLVKKLKDLGINVPASMTINSLRQLYIENAKDRDIQQNIDGNSANKDAADSANEDAADTRSNPSDAAETPHPSSAESSSTSQQINSALNALSSVTNCFDCNTTFEAKC